MTASQMLSSSWARSGVFLLLTEFGYLLGHKSSPFWPLNSILIEIFVYQFSQKQEKTREIEGRGDERERVLKERDG